MQIAGDHQRVHPFVVALVVFHVLIITIYALPKPSPPVVEGRAEPHGSDIFLKWNDAVLKTNPVVTGYTYTTGTWQYWDMFAPNPAQTDIWCDAEVIYFDGSRTTYQYPRVKLVPIPTKYMIERFRKYYERVNQEQYKFLWESFAHRIALINASEQKNPPVMVKLTRHWQEVRRHDAGPGLEPAYNKYQYFTYIVDQKLIREQKGWASGHR